MIGEIIKEKKGVRRIESQFQDKYCSSYWSPNIIFVFLSASIMRFLFQHQTHFPHYKLHSLCKKTSLNQTTMMPSFAIDPLSIPLPNPMVNLMAINKKNIRYIELNSLAEEKKFL